MGLVIDPMAKLLGVAGEKNKSVVVLRTSRWWASWQCRYRKGNKSEKATPLIYTVARIVRSSSLKDSALCFHSFLASTVQLRSANSPPSGLTSTGFTVGVRGLPQRRRVPLKLVPVEGIVYLARLTTTLA